MSVLRAVIFDMDGVITETSRQHFMAWKQLAKELGCDISEDINEQVKGISRMESLEIVLKEMGMTDSFSEAEKLELAEKKNTIYKDLISQFTPENLSAGALELLMSLKKNGILVALASVSKNAEFLLKAMGIKEYFDAVVDPAEISHGKPAPDIFLMAAKKLGVDPEYCIGIEDAYAGIEAIKSAGMKAIGIGSKAELSNCDDVYSGLSELNIEILKNKLS